MAQSAPLHNYQNAAFASPSAFVQAGHHHGPSFPPTAGAVPGAAPGNSAAGPAAAYHATVPLPNTSQAYFYPGPTPPAQAQSLAAAPPAPAASSQPSLSQQAFPGVHAGQYHGGNASMGSMGPAMIPTGSYTSGTFNQTVPAQASSQQLQASDQQQLQQQPPASVNSSHSASPQPRLSPNAALHHSRQHQQQQTPPTKHPMAAPPLPQSPANAGSYGSSNPTAVNPVVAPSPPSPQSPGSQSLENQRVNLLFEINVELLQEVNRLQSSGHGGALSPQQSAQLRSENKPDQMASDEYIQCLRRVQANLAYLMPRVSPNDQAKAPLGPAHMTPPPHMPQLQSHYDRLRELFPNWQGLDARMASSSSSPRTSIGAGANRPNGP